MCPPLPPPPAASWCVGLKFLSPTGTASFLAIRYFSALMFNSTSPIIYLLKDQRNLISLQKCHLFCAGCKAAQCQFVFTNLQIHFPLNLYFWFPCLDQVMYKEKDSDSAVRFWMVEGNASHSVQLTSLGKYVLYEIQVLAFTRIGDGRPSSPPILERTLDDGTDSLAMYMPVIQIGL